MRDGWWARGDLEVRIERGMDGICMWSAWRYHPETGRLDDRLCAPTTARAAMRAADKATP